MSTTLTGKVLEIFPIQEIKSSFSIREFVIETDEQYPQTLKLQTSGKTIGLLDNIKVGMKVDVSYNIKGKVYTNPETGKTSYFMTLTAWRINLVGKPVDKPAYKQKEYSSVPKQVDDEMFPPNLYLDDLPF